MNGENAYSPFIPATDNFCGREPFFDLLANRLSAEPPRRHILVTGIGGIGKTSLMQRMLSLSSSEEYRNRFHIRQACLINMESTGDDLIRVCDLIRHVLSTCGTASITSKVLPLVRRVRPSVGFPLGISFSLADPKLDSAPKDFEVLKERLFRELSVIVSQGIPLVFYVDPMEKMLEWTLGARCFCRLISDILAATRRSRVLFILSCRPDGKGDIEHYLEPGLFDARYVEHVPLGPLSPQEAQEAIKSPAARQGVTLCDHLVQSVSGKCGGHPYNLQLACYHLWNYIDSAGLLSHANIDLGDNTIEQILKNTQRTLFQEGFNDIEKTILRTLALGCTPLVEQEVTTRARLHFNVESNTTIETLHTLLKKHGHRPIKYEGGRYSIAHDLFSDYIREHECEREEQELDVARSEVVARMLAWKLGDRTPLHPSTLALARKYLATLTIDDETLEMILMSEGIVGNADALKVYALQFGMERCKKALLRLLNNLDDDPLGVEILEILAAGPERVRAEALFSAWSHPGARVRIKTLEGFATLPQELLNQKEACSVIWSALKDPNAEVREAGVRASMDLGKPYWEAWNEANELYRVADKLALMLFDPERSVAVCASRHLAMIGELGIKRLLSVIAPYGHKNVSYDRVHKVQQARILALEALAETQDRHLYERIRTEVIKALSDPIPAVRIKAIEFLGGRKDLAAVPELGQLLKAEQSTDVRLSAIEVLGQIGAEAADVLAHQLTSMELKVRLAAISALGQLGSVSVPILEKLLRSREAREPTAETWEVWHEALAALLHIGPDTKDVLLGLLNHRYGRVRRSAVQGLARLDIAEAKEPIRKLLNDSDILVQREAIEALGRLHDMEAGPFLAPMLCHKDPAIRDKAATSLRHLGSEALRVLMRTLESRGSKTGEVYAKLQEILNTLP